MLEKHIFDLIPAYVMGALDTEEAQLAAQHLQQCVKCREELKAYYLLVADMGLASPQRMPHPRIKERLMKQVAQPDVQKPADRIRSLLRQMPRLSLAWNIVSLVLILVLAGSNLFLWQQPRQSQSELRAISLRNTAAAPNATGLLVLSKDGEYGTLVVDGLPALKDSQQYQLWLITDGKRTSGGVFSVSAQGYGSLWIDSPKPLSFYEGFGITIEPFGGSSGPTGNKVLGGEF